MKRHFLMTLCFLLLTTAVAFASDSYTMQAGSHFGGNFVKEVNGVNITFTFTDNDHEAVQVGGVYVGFVAWGIAYPAVDKSTYGTVVIPSAVEYEGRTLPVEAIHISAFENVPISKVKIPASVKKIERDAFYGCTELTEVEFEGAEDRTVKIDTRAFFGCKQLKSLTGDYRISSIGSWAFRNSGLETIEIPRTCKEISPDAFFNCKSMKRFYAQSHGCYSVDSDGVLFSGSKLVAYPSGRANADYTIPKRTEEIGAYAFNCCDNLARLTIPASVRRMEETCIWICEKIRDTGGYLKLEWLDGQEIPLTGKYTFGGMPYNILIPKGTEDLYQYGVWGTLKQSTYDVAFPFSVDGIAMTSENYRDYRQGVTSGTISYSPREKVLTLDNVSMSATKAEAEDITIRFVGDNTMQLRQAFTIKGDDTYFDGPGSLTLNSDDCGLAIEGYLMLENTPQVEINAKTPIDGSGKGGINMDTPAYLTLHPGNGKPVVGMKYFDMDESIIASPQGAYFRNGELYTSAGPVYGSVEITPRDDSKSPLSICGIRLTELNWYDITQGVTEGKVSYNWRTNTLTLDNATITCDKSSACGINIRADLTISLIGDNYIRSDNHGISIDVAGTDIFVTGPGTLDIESKSGFAVYVGDNDITFDGVTTQLYGRNGCLGGVGSDPTQPGTGIASVHFVNTDATLAPCEDSVTPLVSGIGNLTLENCAFTAPAGVHFHKPSATLCDLSGYPLAGNAVSIARSSGSAEYSQLYVAGIPVTDGNKSCIMDGVTYDSDSNILILHDADINGWIANFNLATDRLGKNAKSLEVRVLGNNRLTQNSHTPIVTVGQDSEIAISGDGTLNIRNEGQYYGIALLDGATLRLTDTTIDVESQLAAISGGSSSTKSERTRLIIDNTTLHAKATGTDHAAIEGIGRVQHVWCTFTSPVNAYYNYNDGSSMTGLSKASDVTIAPRASGLMIAGTPITKDYAQSPEDGDGTSLLKSGKYTYDDYTKTLRLFDATIEATEEDTDGIFIDTNNNRASSEGLSIVYSGKCTIKGTRHAIFAKDENDWVPIEIMSIAYDKDEPKDNVSTLTLATTGTTAVRLASTEAFICLYDADVKVVGDITGIGIDDDNSFSLETSGCNLLIDGSVSDLCGFWFDKEYYSYDTPGQYFDANKGYVANADGTKANRVYVLRNDGINPFDNNVERPKDVNLDGVTDVADIASVIDVMASDDAGSTTKAASDTNGDGETDVADVATVIDAMAGE